MFQGLVGHTTCTSKLPSENAKARFISVGIVTRWWIMHTRKVVGIVFCCEVWHLLQNVCLCNGCFNFAFIFTFSSKNLLTSLNWIAPTALHSPPFVLHTGGAESYAASDWRNRVKKIFSNLQSNTGVILSISATTVRDNSLAQSWRKKLLNFDSTCRLWEAPCPVWSIA